MPIKKIHTSHHKCCDAIEYVVVKMVLVTRYPHHYCTHLAMFDPQREDAIKNLVRVQVNCEKLSKPRYANSSIATGICILQLHTYISSLANKDIQMKEKPYSIHGIYLISSDPAVPRPAMGVFSISKSSKKAPRCASLFDERPMPSLSLIQKGNSSIHEISSSVSISIYLGSLSLLCLG